MRKLNSALFVSVFITGAAVLILEVAAVRLLSPYYGSSLYVFSSVLSIILAALSCGYWYGGKRADAKQSISELYKIITLSGVLILLLELVALFVLPAAAAQLGPQLGPLVFSLALFFVPAFLLGIVSPYIIKIQSINTPTEHIGSVVGKTFFWGTAGSILGSLLTGFWLIPTLGVQNTIMTSGACLIILGLLMPLYLRQVRHLIWIALIIGVSILLLGSINLIHTRNQASYLYYSDGLYSSIKIRDVLINNRAGRLLNRDTNNSSAIYLTSKELPFAYTQFAEFYNILVPSAEDFLLIGGGAYTIPRTLSAANPELNIDVVEIEPILFNLAQEYFDLSDTSRITNYPMDARVFLQGTNKRYDVIFADAFGTDLAAPFHLTTLEFYQRISEHLHDEGVLLVNFVGIPETSIPSLFGSVTKTLLAVFPNTRAYAIEKNELSQLQNVILVARKGVAPINFTDQHITFTGGGTSTVQNLTLDLTTFDLTSEILLTDDFAPVEKLQARQ